MSIRCRWWFQLNLSFAHSVGKLLLVSLGEKKKEKEYVQSVEGETCVNEEQKMPLLLIAQIF